MEGDWGQVSLIMSNHLIFIPSVKPAHTQCPRWGILGGGGGMTVKGWFPCVIGTEWKEEQQQWVISMWDWYFLDPGTMCQIGHENLTLYLLIWNWTSESIPDLTNYFISQMSRCPQPISGLHLKLFLFFCLCRWEPSIHLHKNTYQTIMWQLPVLAFLYFLQGREQSLYPSCSISSIQNTPQHMC